MMQMVDVGPADRIDEADGKTALFRRCNTARTLLETARTPQGIVDRRAGAVQAETEVIHFVRIHPVEDVVKKVAVGINGDGCVSELPGPFDGNGQIRMHGGLAAQKNHVG
jgi:hypothetical protein